MVVGVVVGVVASYLIWKEIVISLLYRVIYYLYSYFYYCYFADTHTNMYICMALSLYIYIYIYIYYRLIISAWMHLFSILRRNSTGGEIHNI